MSSPENYEFSSTQLQEGILHDSEEINQYYRLREGEYARLKVGKMLGAIAAKYSNIPVFVNGASLILPSVEGSGFGLGELTGKIAGFTYSDLGGEVEQWKPGTEGVVMQVSVPTFGADDSPDASWRLNALPEEMRNDDIEGYIIGVPVTKNQTILQLGGKEQLLTPQSLITPERSLKEYSYLEYVKNIQALTKNKPTFNQNTDAAKIQALDTLIKDMVFECPYIGNIVAIDASYLRHPKPNSDGYTVGYGQVAGVLRKFVHDIYQDYQTKEWLSDIMAVVYNPEVASLVTSGKLSPKEADTLPTTTYVPLSRPHVLATGNGIKY